MPTNDSAKVSNIPSLPLCSEGKEKNCGYWKKELP